MFYFDPMYLVFLAPAILLGLWAQYPVHAAFAQGHEVPAEMSGAEAARRVLDSDGLYDVQIEAIHGLEKFSEVGGELSQLPVAVSDSAGAVCSFCSAARSPARMRY